ncbi:MAG: glycosyltransferase family 2 protein [Weeksellaceae bacterium]|nr:glycosyltransferase family 2 protein [Weeksellaceae bacterium]
MEVSIVIPLLNEAESLPELHRRIHASLAPKHSYEIIFIDDGSTDNSWEVISQLSQDNEHVKGIRFRKNYGKSQALNAAFEAARGEIVVTMDADLQDFPEEVPAMVERMHRENLDLLSGWKQKRQDPVMTKNIPSKLFNWVARKTSGLELHDFNCGLKAYRHELVKSVELRSDMHRYIPVLAKNLGFAKIDEQRVQHTARVHGSSKFGRSRFVNGFLDLITLWFVGKFGHRPMHFFGLLGSLMFFLGFVVAFFIGAKKIVMLQQGIPARLVTDDPWFYIALTVMIIGTQLFLAGFLGEMIIRTQSNAKTFEIREKIG